MLTNVIQPVTDDNQISIPIRDLHPYVSSRRVLVTVRVVHKSLIRTWQKKDGSTGKFFNMELIDSTGLIIMTGFDHQVEKFFNVVQIGSVYRIGKFGVNYVNRAFNDLSHSCEMLFTKNTEIVKCVIPEMLGVIPFDYFNFVKISEISNLPFNARVDLIGIVKHIGLVQSVVSNYSCELIQKLVLVLFDDSNTEIVVTLWGDSAVSFEGKINQIIAVKRGKVFEFIGKSINISGSARISINPDVTETSELRNFLQRSLTMGLFNIKSETSRV